MAKDCDLSCGDLRPRYRCSWQDFLLQKFTTPFPPLHTMKSTVMFIAGVCFCSYKYYRLCFRIMTCTATIVVPVYPAAVVTMLISIVSNLLSHM